MALHRMRTISEAKKMIKQSDPATSMTECAIRTLCKEGKVHCVYTGKKILLDYDDLLALLSGDQQPVQTVEPVIEKERLPISPCPLLGRFILCDIHIEVRH